MQVVVILLQVVVGLHQGVNEMPRFCRILLLGCIMELDGMSGFCCMLLQDGGGRDVVILLQVVARLHHGVGRDVGILV